MDFLLLLEAIIELGIPMVILSWIIFTWLYDGCDLDRNADRKSVEAQVKKIKKSFREKEAWRQLELHDGEVDVVR